jgi:hypothetical protein
MNLDKWPLIVELARARGVSEFAIAKWRASDRGGVPWNLVHKLITDAKARGKRLKIEDLRRDGGDNECAA